MPGALSLRVLDRNGIPVTGVKYDILESDEITCFGVIHRDSGDASAVVVQIPDDAESVTVRASKYRWSETRTFGRDKVQFDYRSDLEMPSDHKRALTYLSFAVGVGFLLLLLILSGVYPSPTSAQRQIWQAILSVSLAAFANGILGLLEVNVNIPSFGLTIRAIGAIAIAIIVYFFVPAFSK